MQNPADFLFRTKLEKLELLRSRGWISVLTWFRLINWILKRGETEQNRKITNCYVITIKTKRKIFLVCSIEELYYRKIKEFERIRKDKGRRKKEKKIHGRRTRKKKKENGSIVGKMIVAVIAVIFKISYDDYERRQRCRSVFETLLCRKHRA